MASNSSESSFAQKKIKGIFSKGFMVAKIMKILKEEGKLTFFRQKVIFSILFYESFVDCLPLVTYGLKLSLKARI